MDTKTELIIVPLVVGNRAQSNDLGARISGSVDGGLLPGVIDIVTDTGPVWDALTAQIADAVTHPTGVGAEKGRELAEAHVEDLRRKGSAILGVVIDPAAGGNVAGVRTDLYGIKNAVTNPNAAPRD